MYNFNNIKIYSYQKPCNTCLTETNSYFVKNSQYPYKIMRSYKKKLHSYDNKKKIIIYLIANIFIYLFFN